MNSFFSSDFLSSIVEYLSLWNIHCFLLETYFLDFKLSTSFNCAIRFWEKMFFFAQEMFTFPEIICDGNECLHIRLFVGLLKSVDEKTAGHVCWLKKLFKYIYVFVFSSQAFCFFFCIPHTELSMGKQTRKINPIFLLPGFVSLCKLRVCHRFIYLKKKERNKEHKNQNQCTNESSMDKSNKTC